MAITGRSGVVGTTAEVASSTTVAILDAIISLRKRLAMEQDQQVDSGDIRTDDVVLNTERTS